MTELTPYGEWQAAILAAIDPLPTERVLLSEAHGRVLAAPVAAAWPLPPFTSSAMDGFAVRGADAVAGGTLRVVGESSAGHPWGGTVAAGEAVHISTGAVVPTGADTIVPVEHTANDGAQVQVTEGIDPGAYVRHAGEDVPAGTELLAAGAVVGPSELGLLAAGGIAAVDVGGRPRVTVMSTGDEVVGPTADPGPGQVRDVNALTLSAMAADAGADAVAEGPVPDTSDALRAALRAAAATSDVVITTGGVSVGDHDLVKQVLTELGDVQLAKVAMRPGMPQAFGLLDAPTRRVPVFGLPGNPVSAAVSFEMFVRPAVRKLSGATSWHRAMVTAELAEPATGLPNKVVFARVELARAADGWIARLAGKDGSHLFRSFAAADGLAEVPLGTDTLPPGAQVTVHCLRDRL